MSYLKERGFGLDIIQKFGLGYAPESRDALTKEAVAAQYNKDLLQRSGLVTERDGGLRDNYRDRVIFPIHDLNGRVVHRLCSYAHAGRNEWSWDGRSDAGLWLPAGVYLYTVMLTSDPATPLTSPANKRLTGRLVLIR